MLTALTHVDYSLLHKKLQSNFDLVIPFLKFGQELENELLLLNARIISKNETYFIVENLSSKPIWAQDWWPDCRLHPFATKNEAVKILKNTENLGVYFSNENEPALAAGLKKKLRDLKLKRIRYEVPSKFNFKYFSWTLFDDSNLIICKAPNSRYPLGWNEFEEDKDFPPNRAYLKIWEILCLGYIQLNGNEEVIDLGSSPGGWSWALSRYVKKVHSVDRSPLAPKIAARPNIRFHTGDAFAVQPGDYNQCQWLFSDIICTPARLLSLVENWMAHSEVKNFVCTIKFKGECDFDIIKNFLAIPGSKIIHLYQNKNEVTWIRQENK